MAKPHGSSTPVRSLDPYLNQPELLSVTSKICASRLELADPRVCRLIIDSRLHGRPSRSMAADPGCTCRRRCACGSTVVVG